MQMQGIALPQRTVIARAVQQAAQAVGIEQIPVRIVVLGEQTLPRTQHHWIAKPVGPDHAFVDDITIDLILRDAIAHQANRVLRAGVQGARCVAADAFDQAAFAERISGEYKAAIATGGAVADAL